MFSLPNLAVTLLAAAAAAPVSAAAAAVAGAGDSPSSLKPRIEGGVPAQPGAWPFIVSMTRNGSHWCAGTLINPHTVLSTAHCFYGARGANVSLFQVRAGSDSWLSGGVVSRVSQIILHPLFNNTIIDNDLSLLELTTPIEEDGSSICYAKLPEQGFDPPAGANMTFAAWGIENLDMEGHYPEYLRQLTQPIIDRHECNVIIDIAVPLTRGAFCAGFLKEAGKNQCRGDSGGPAVGTDTGGVLWGFPIAGGTADDCAPLNAPGINTNVGQYVDWINENAFC